MSTAVVIVIAVVVVLLLAALAAWTRRASARGGPGEEPGDGTGAYRSHAEASRDREQG